MLNFLYIPCLTIGLPDFKLKVNADDWIFVEVTHKRVPIGMAIATRLTPGMAFKEFGALQVRIKSRTGADNRTDEHLASEIIREVDKILEGATKAHVKRALYEIQYDPSGDPRTLEILFGTEVTYNDDLERLAFLTLQNKEEHGQLRDRAHEGYPCVIGVDFRAWTYGPRRDLPADSSRNYYYQTREERRKAIVRGCQSFLTKSSIIIGVLGYWRKDETGMTFDDLIFNRFVFSLITLDGEICLTPDNFQQALGGLSLSCNNSPNGL